MQGKISKRAVDALQAGQSIADDEVRGFIARMLPSGSVSYGYRYRNRGGRQRWLPIGLHGTVTPDKARLLAKQFAGEVASGRDPVAERDTAKTTEGITLNEVLDEFVKRHVEARQLRSAHRVKRNIDRLLRPELGPMSIYEIRRRHLITLFDKIEDSSGARTADQALANLLCAFRFWSDRDESFAMPVVRRRVKPSEHERIRTLNDDEIRTLWTALDDVPHDIARFVKTLLLTGQRRIEVAGMHVREIKDDVWTIPAVRFKGKRDHVVPLSRQAQALIAGRTGFVFSRGHLPITAFSRVKSQIDAAVTAVRDEPMAHWTLHDLRRTARSLMSKVTTPDVAERVIGHKIGGIRGVYDKHEYLDEKTNALQRFADLIDRIVDPSATVLLFVRKS